MVVDTHVYAPARGHGPLRGLFPPIGTEASDQHVTRHSRVRLTPLGAKQTNQPKVSVPDPIAFGGDLVD